MSARNIPIVVFPLGSIVATPKALEVITQEDIVQALRRHQAGDWGEVDVNDREENELSHREGFRLLSVYYAKNGVKFWIITEADRSGTTILLPEDY